MARSRRISIFLSLLLVLAIAFLLVSTVVALGIQRASAGDPLRKADAIVVFGAAEYAGRPSPVLKARLDHALDLFQRGLAPVV
ncbi:MAG TPA: hypothetical protein VHA14_02855, partial [Bryobacteraceae bacterium]|nr:hypothetical protein [Bryobacteraceae bacterium]